MRLVISGSSLSIGDKVIVASGSSTRVDAFQHLPLVGRELNAPLLGHNPSQWPRNPGLLVTATSTLCNTTRPHFCFKCTNDGTSLHLMEASPKNTKCLVEGSTVQHFRCFPVLPWSTVVPRLVPRSLKLNHGALVSEPTHQSAVHAPSYWATLCPCLYHHHHPS